MKSWIPEKRREAVLGLLVLANLIGVGLLLKPQQDQDRDPLGQKGIRDSAALPRPTERASAPLKAPASVATVPTLAMFLDDSRPLEVIALNSDDPTRLSTDIIDVLRIEDRERLEIEPKVAGLIDGLRKAQNAACTGQIVDGVFHLTIPPCDLDRKDFFRSMKDILGDQRGEFLETAVFQNTLIDYASHSQDLTVEPDTDGTRHSIRVYLDGDTSPRRTFTLSNEDLAQPSGFAMNRFSQSFGHLLNVENLSDFLLKQGK